MGTKKPRTEQTAKGEQGMVQLKRRNSLNGTRDTGAEGQRLVIVDDHPLFRKGVVGVLQEEPALQVVGEAQDGHEALRLVEELEPDIVLMDVNLPGLSGLEVTHVIRRRWPHVAVIIMTSSDDDEQLFAAIKAGAAAYLSKSAQGQDLLETVRSVARGHYPINDAVLSKPSVASKVLDQFRQLATQSNEMQSFFSPLTNRELEILDCIARGNSNKEIARLLKISDQTVKNHITSILRKLAVNDRTQAVIYALRHGWIKMEEGPFSGKG
jgi:DNA-binding NarL/FixJ family response regulator